MMRTVALLIVALATLAVSSDGRTEEVVLFPYFDSNGENGVYLCWSKDGREFHPVNQGRAVFVPPAWKGQSLTRDPSIVFDDGRFHMVWTTNWAGGVLGYAWSPDLETWSAPKTIRPFPSGSEQPKNVWAPELLRDHVAGDWKIIWSSTLPSELADGDGSEDTHGNDHRMYYIATKDFTEFSAPELAFQDEGYSVIDAQVAWDEANDRWVMALKKELPASSDGKNIRFAFSPRKIAPASFGDATQPVVGPGAEIGGPHKAEGPSLLHYGGQWLLYWDSYGAKHYSLATSPDLVGWQDETKRLRLPARHPRHGTMFVAPSESVGWDLEER